MKIEFFINVLADSISEIGSSCDPDYECIDISNWDGKSIHDSDILFILSANRLKEFSESCEKGVVPHVLLSEARDLIKNDYGIPFLACTTDHDALWKEIRHSFHLLQRYDHIAMNALLDNAPLDEILERTAEYWKASFYLFSEGGQLMISTSRGNSDSSIEIENFEGISFASFFNSLTPVSFDKSIAIISRPFNRSAVMLKRINKDKMTYWVIAEVEKSLQTHLIYAFKLIGTITEQQLSIGNTHAPETDTEFSKAVGLILDNEITDPKKIAQIVTPGDSKESPHCFQILLIGGKDRPLENSMLKKHQKTISQNYPDILTAIYAGEIIAIFHYPVSAARYYEKKLNQLVDKDYIEGSSWLRDYLKKNDLRAILGEPNRKKISFRACWQLNHDSLRICRRLPDFKDRVCISSELTKIFWILEAGVNYFQDNVASLSPVLLCSRAFVTLCYYDAAHNTNLNNVLISYIRNNRNIEKTAQECFMHRNTIKNKIELIKSLLHIDLDNTEYFLGLTVSHLLIEYFTHYMGGDIMADTESLE